MTKRDLGSLMANAIRSLAMDGVEKAKSGHPGLPMGAADVATVLFSRFMRFDASDPHWADRDRFILSAGHGSMLLYALLHLVGVESVTDTLSVASRRFEFLGTSDQVTLSDADPNTTGAVTLAMLTRLDLVTIWVTVLLAVGLYAAGKLTKEKAITAGVVIWLLGCVFPLWGAIRQG